MSALGHNVRLVINRKDLLHRPEAIYPEWQSAYPPWLVDCGFLTDDDVAYETAALDQVIHHLVDGVDLVILNDIGPALAERLRCPHVALLTGSDLAYCANFESLEMRTRGWDPAFRRSTQGRRYLRRMADFVARQRDGILSAKVVCYGHRGLVPEGDQLLDAIGVVDTQRLMLCLSNIRLSAQPPTANEKLRILCGTRIVFRREDNPALSAMDFKGTDILLRGYALYTQRGGQGQLHLPRKGQDLHAARAMIRELGIEHRVVWRNEVPLSKFYEEMSASDVVCDQFETSFPGMVTADAYALARPVMANLRNDVYGLVFPEPLPGFDARTAEEIAAHLIHLETNRDLLAEVGARSRAYAEIYLSPVKMAEQLLKRCGSCAE
jgi:glycosyltransferase involved in cell wall biosynthesis